MIIIIIVSYIIVQKYSTSKKGRTLNHPEEDFQKSKHVGRTLIKFKACQQTNSLREFFVVINHFLIKKKRSIYLYVHINSNVD